MMRMSSLTRFGAAAIVLSMISADAFALDKDEKKEKKKEALSPYQIVDQAPASAWRPLDLENTLLIDLPSGQVVVEMRPDFAPGHVARVKELVREGFYDGLTFHRVIEGFMAQGGDPKGDGTGSSDKPDLKGEFERDTREMPNFADLGRDRIASRIGYVDGMLAAAQPESLRSFKADKTVSIWGIHCPGVTSMARAASPDSANSQFFLMIGDSRLNLDRRYSVWGWIVDGYENARRIMRGEPPSRPTPIVRMRIASDVPASEHPKVKVMRTDSENFKRYFNAHPGVTDGLVRDICDIKAPRRVNGELEL